MTLNRLISLPLLIAFVACADGGDDKDTDETDTTASDDTDDAGSDDTDDAGSDDTDDAGSDDTDDTDVALTIDVSDWEGSWTVTQQSGSLCGQTAPSTVVVEGTSATTFNLVTDYGTPGCTFSTNTAFSCTSVNYGGADISVSGTWNDIVINATIGVSVPNTCTESAQWTISPPVIEQPSLR